MTPRYSQLFESFIFLGRYKDYDLLYYTRQDGTAEQIPGLVFVDTREPELFRIEFDSSEETIIITEGVKRVYQAFLPLENIIFYGPLPL